MDLVLVCGTDSLELFWESELIWGNTGALCPVDVLDLCYYRILNTLLHHMECMCWNGFHLEG